MDYQHRTSCSIAIAALLTMGCAHLSGFAGYDGDVAGKVLDDTRRIATMVREQPTDEVSKRDALAFLLPELSLAHHRVESFEGYRLSGIRSRFSRPATLYPRLTWPHLARPDKNESCYRVPLLLHREAFRAGVDPCRDLAFRLVPRGGRGCAVTAKASCPNSTTLRLQTGREAAFPGLHADGIPVLLRVSVCDVRPNTLYDVEILPRESTKRVGMLAQHAENGAWLKFAASLANCRAPEQLTPLIAAVRHAAQHPLFAEALDGAADKLCAARAAGLGPEAREPLQAAVSAFRGFAAARWVDAPIWLDDGCTEQAYSFLVAGDLQLHHDAASASRFFALLERSVEATAGCWRDTLAERLHQTMTSPQVDDWLASVGPRRLQLIKEAKFVVLVGDCVDGAASQALGKYAANLTGLDGPASPLVEGGEIERLHELLRTSSKPVFAVPGNHDVGVGYGGILNWPLDLLGLGIHWISEDAAAWIRDLNGVVPGLIRPTLGGAVPCRYDGLEEWQYALGPANLAFEYRGSQFVCLNSFHLDCVHRASVGGVAMNTGGGIQDLDAAWFKIQLAAFSDPQVRPASVGAARDQFVFMHHDPRAAYPVAGRPEEVGFGNYETIDTPIAALTFGYFGSFSYGTWNGIYVPLISAPAEWLYRSLVGVKDRLVREWMRRCYWEESTYGAKELVTTIGAHLHRPGDIEASRTGIRSMFFAHNNSPLVSKWLRDEDSRLLFRGRDEAEWRVSSIRECLMNLVHLFVTVDDKIPPAWAREVTVDRGNADVVRLDDVSDSWHDDLHGFSLVHLGGAQDVFEIEHVPLPTTHRR